VLQHSEDQMAVSHYFHMHSIIQFSFHFNLERKCGSLVSIHVYCTYSVRESCEVEVSFVLVLYTLPQIM
jgi:hypothetical protein